MIVGDLDIERITTLPSKTDTPLVVDSNAVLLGSLSGKTFEPVAGRHPEIAQGFGGIEEQQLAVGTSLNVVWELLGPFTPEDFLRFSIAKTPDHDA